jgi:hypothetical protein
VLGSFSGAVMDIYSGLAYDATNDIMYGIGFNWSGSFGANTSFLFKINPQTLTATTIAAIPGADVCLSLAYDDVNKVLYTVDFNTGNLIRLNPLNASPTVVGNIGYSQYQVFIEGDFNDFTGELILSIVDQSYNTNIFKVNPLNANKTLITTVPNTELLIAINTSSNPVPLKWYYFLLVFLIPIALIVRKRLF